MSSRLALAAFWAASAGVSADSSPYYWRYPRTDVAGNDIMNVPGLDPDQLMAACNGLPTCLGFNTDGWLKDALPPSGFNNSAPCDLFVKASVPEPPRLSILPKPVSLSNGSTTVFVGKGFSFSASTASPDLDAAFARYQAIIFPHAWSQSVQTLRHRHVVLPAGTPTLTSLVVNVVNVSVPLQLGVDESYTLSVPADGSPATLTAATVYGAYHGLETFSQVVRFDFDAEAYTVSFAPLVIKDAPAFAYRGILIDTSRHFEPLPTIFKIVDSMAQAKLSVLHWHIVDFQSWPIQSLAYPKLWNSAWSPAERYTLSDAAAVVEYARQRGIVVIPEFDNPGHADSVCVGYPEACPAPNCTAPLNPASNFTFDLIQGVLTEWAAIFPSQYMHLGGDEVDTSCWSESATISAWMSAQGFTPYNAYEYFVLRADAISRTLGKSAMRWEEVWNAFGTSLPRDTIIHVWLDHATLANVTAHGYYGVMSDNGNYYLDHLDLSWETIYDDDPLAGVASGNAKFVLGGETCQWGETADASDVMQTIWPRAAASAERLWSYDVVTDSTDPAAFVRMSDFRCRLLSRNVPAAPLNNAEAREAPSGPGSCEWQ